MIPMLNLNQFNIVKQNAIGDEESGCYDSDMDIEAAHQAIKPQVENTFAKYNCVPAQIPSMTTSNKKTSIG